MRKEILIVGLLFLSLTLAADQCNQPCTESAECTDKKTCGLCIDKVCQHRCAANDVACMFGEEPKRVAAQCGDPCSGSSDCKDCGSCRLCLSGTCQHRCATNDLTCMAAMSKLETLEVKAAACGDTCSSSSDCANAGSCRLCLEGTCQHRCAASPNSAECLFRNLKKTLKFN